MVSGHELVGHTKTLQLPSIRFYMPPRTVRFQLKAVGRSTKLLFFLQFYPRVGNVLPTKRGCFPWLHARFIIGWWPAWPASCRRTYVHASTEALLPRC